MVTLSTSALSYSHQTNRQSRNWKPLLEVEAELRPEIERYKATGDNSAYSRIICAYQVHLVGPKVYRLMSTLSLETRALWDSEDLEQEGVFGLIEALDKYDPSRNVPFYYYATFPVGRRIIDAIRKTSPNKRLRITRSKKIDKAIDSLKYRKNWTPTHEELKQELGVDAREYRLILKNGRAPRTVHFTSFEDDMEDIPIGNHITASEKLEKRSLKSVLLKGLDRQEKLMVVLYYYKNFSLGQGGRKTRMSKIQSFSKT